MEFKIKAKIKYHRWLEVWIFISRNKRFQDQNRIETPLPKLKSTGTRKRSQPSVEKSAVSQGRMP